MCCCEAERFCFRFSLRHGAIAAACLSVFLCSASFVLGILIHIFPEEILKFKSWILEGSSSDPHDINKVYVIGYAVLGGAFLTGVSAVCLIIGIVKKYDLLFLPWLGIWLIIFLFFLIIVTLQSTLSIYVILPASFIIGINIYLWIAVHSYYNRLPSIYAMQKRKRLIFNGPMEA